MGETCISTPSIPPLVIASIVRITSVRPTLPVVVDPAVVDTVVVVSPAPVVPSGPDEPKK